jgi:DNA-binding SARP family transcriptional activator/predicted ATPase
MESPVGEELKLALLGNVEICRDGAPVTRFRTSKNLALLCYLAVTGRAHSRADLAGLLWGELPEANAHNHLRKALTNLRQLVGPYLSITRQSVAFNHAGAYWLDVELFEAGLRGVSPEADIEGLGEAVELYRGDFLEGLYVRGALAFEEWVLAERARLRELALDALHTLAVHHTRRGHTGHAAAMDYTTRLLAMEPWREEAHRGLMLLLAREGERGAALAQYQTCRQVLADELGVEPAPETADLYQRIRDGELGGPLPAPVAPPSFLSTPPPHPPPRAPFVSRERELAQLDGFLELALAGRGRVVFVTGEAGTGKTVLVGEFTRRAQEQHAGLVVAGGNCNAYTGAGDPYLPFRDILSLLTGDVEARWAAGAISQEGACRLWSLVPHSAQTLVEAGPDLVDSFIPGRSLFTRAALAMPDGADWLGQLQELVAKKEANPGRAGLKQRDLFEQYSQVLQTLARERPLLLVLDDLQWADTGSINLLFHLGRRLAGGRLLVVGVYRPAEVALGRGGERHPLEPVVNELQRHFGNIQVDLRQSEDRRFVEALVDTEPNRLGVEFREALYQQTRGHALFTVEMLHGMQERGDLVQDERGRWIEGLVVDWQTLPARVEGVIGERIGRLPAGLQAALKVASVEGEVFTAEVVARVRAAGELDTVQQLSDELDQQHRLVRGDGCRQLGPGGQRLSCYRFRHILFQRYLYNSLGEAERIYLHESVGNELEWLYSEHTQEVAVGLAHHFHVAGISEKAIGYTYQAGERAARLSAHEEAIGHFTRALALLETLPGTPERARQELRLQIALGTALTATKGFAAPEVGRTFNRARELCRQASARGKGETPEVFSTLWGLWAFYFTRAEHATAGEIGEELLHLAQDVGEPGLLLQAHHALWTSFLSLGEFVSARTSFEQGLALYNPQEHHPQANRYGGHDPGVCCRSFAGPILWALGYPDQALGRNCEALALARNLSHPFSLTLALGWLATTHQQRCEAEAAQERAEATIALSSEGGFAYWLGWGRSLQGWALAQQGDIEAGVVQMREGIDAFRATGSEFACPYMLALLAALYAKARRAEQGLAALDEALALVNSNGERWYEAELYRLRGELLLMQDEAVSEAEACFRQAIEVARRQEAKSLELRAAMSLGRLWHAQGAAGKREEARQMLSGIYDWFTEGFDTPDLIEAKALLDALA